MVNTSETFNLTANTPKKLDFGDTDPVTAVVLTTSLTDNWVTIATTGTYEVTVSGSFESAASSSVYTFGLRKDNSGTFNLEDAGTVVTSNSAVISNLEGEINGTNPSIKWTSGASASTHQLIANIETTWVTD